MSTFIVALDFSVSDDRAIRRAVKLVNLELLDGERVGLPFAIVREFPPMREAVEAFRSAVKQGLLRSSPPSTPTSITTSISNAA